MFKKILSILSLALLTFGYFSCSEESDPAFDQNSFTKIYDNSSFTATYYPIDIEQTADGGYIMLARTVIEDAQFYGTYLMKADKDGNFEKELYLDENLINPVGKLMKVGDSYTFFCMDELSNYQAQIVTIDGSVENLTVTPASGLTYPYVAALDNTNFILQSYNHLDKKTVVSILNPSGAILTSKEFDLGAGFEIDPEIDIVEHFRRFGKKIPFQVGRTGATYYFNGLYNYSIALVFTDLNADDPQGAVYGEGQGGGISAVAPISGAKFALARTNFGNNYILPNETLNMTGSSSSGGGNPFPELELNAPIKILRATSESKNVLIYASNTRSKQIGLYFYDEATGEFMSSRYLGFSNPYEIGYLTQTEDGGLAVCGTTYLAGRFPRICLFKLSKEEFEDQL